MPFVFNAAFMEKPTKMTKCVSSWIAKNEEILKTVSKLNAITKPGWIVFYVRMF